MTSRGVDLEHWIPEYARGEPMARLHNANPDQPSCLNGIDLAKLFAIQEIGWLGSGEPGWENHEPF